MNMLRVASLVALFTLLGGCSSIEPWVKPYERAALAEDVMSTDRNPNIDEYYGHVREVREASHGATGAAGGGCGCN
jgi:hypothetical protein